MESEHVSVADVPAPDGNHASTFVRATDSTWKDIIEMSHNHLVFAQFSADWCGFCKKQIPVMHQFHEEDGDWIWALVDTDHTSVKKQYNISGIPVTVCFRNGKEVDRIVGFKDGSSLRAFIDAHRPSRPSQETP